MKTLTTILGIIAIPVILLAGCKSENSKDLSKTADYKGNTVIANIDCNSTRRSVSIFAGKLTDYPKRFYSDQPHIYAFRVENPIESRFNEIDLSRVQNGSVLEKYANLQELESAYEYTIKNGTDTDKVLFNK